MSDSWPAFRTVSSFWFTLVELLMVVTIMSIIGIASIAGFSQMLMSQDAETTTKNITNTLNALDQDISRYRSTSYDMIFESGSIGFITNIDWYKQDSSLQYSYNFSTATWDIRTTGLGTGSIDVHLASQDSIGENLQLSQSGGYKVFSFPSNMQKRWYEITGTKDDIGTNSFNIQYYQLSPIKDAWENEIQLIRIVDSGSLSYDALIIRNVLGKKSLIGSWATLRILEQAVLIFEKNWKEISLALTD